MSWVVVATGLSMQACAQRTPASTTTPDNGVEYIAHRGESADAPENTLAAFLLAWERDVPAIELDVHQTADGELVVIHDATTERTTGVDKVVLQSTLEELRPLDAGSWKGEEWERERIPTLREALDTVPEGSRVFVEIKVGPEAVPAVAETVHASGLEPDQVVIISFNLDTVAEAKRALPEIKAYYLSSFRRDEDDGSWTPTIQELIERARSAGADGLDLSYQGPIDAESVRQIKDAGMDVYVWTVDDPEAARRLIDAGVDGITTNRAAWLRDVLSSAEN